MPVEHFGGGLLEDFARQDRGAGRKIEDLGHRWSPLTGVAQVPAPGSALQLTVWTKVQIADEQ
jgi:hypothetical protein